MNEHFEKLFGLVKKQNPENVFQGNDIHMGSVAKYGIPTGLAELDLFLGQKGGYPAGKIIEFYGFQMCGKTTAALHAAAECQKRGGIVYFIDTEKAYTPLRASELGCNPEEIIKAEADTIEDVFEHIINFMDILEKEKVDIPVLFIVDSITGVPTGVETDADMDDSERPGFEAKQIKRGLKKVNPRLSNLPSSPTIIFINHAYKKFVSFGKNSDSGGGFGIKFYSAVRLEFTALGKIKNKSTDERLGQRIKIDIVKLKGSHLIYDTFTTELTNESGFDRIESLKLAMISSGFADRPKNSQFVTILPGTAHEVQIKQSEFKDWINSSGGYDKIYQSWRKWAIQTGKIAPWGGKD